VTGPAPLPDAAPPEPSSGLRVNDQLVIPRGELEFRASRASGPGGQHVNKTSSRVELLWSPARSAALTGEQRARLAERLASRLDSEGVLRVVSSDTRSQLRNREAAEGRLAELLRKALVVPKKRRPTKPSRAAKQARLDEKRRNAERKRNRKADYD